jgi:GntR family transcriptional regulator
MPLIDKNSQIPKYLQIRNWLYGMIERGKIPVGGKIPTEADLAKDFNVNRMTVRKALEGLLENRMIERERGKGSILISAKPQNFVYELKNIRSFDDDMYDLGLKPHTKNLEKKVLDDRPDIAKQLCLLDDQRIIYTLRVKYAGDVPVLIERSYLPYYEFKEILDMDLGGALYHLLVEEFNVELHHAEQYFSSTVATPREKEIFKVPDPDTCFPCIKMESLMSDPNNIPIEVLHSIYRGDFYKFKIHSGEYLFQKTIDGSS